MSQKPTDDLGIIRQILNATVRVVFHVDVGKMAPDAAEAYLKKVRKAIKKKRFVNPNGAINTPLREFVERVFAEKEWSKEEIEWWNRRFQGLDFRWKPLNDDEDFWLPQRT